MHKFARGALAPVGLQSRIKTPGRSLSSIRRALRPRPSPCSLNNRVNEAPICTQAPQQSATVSYARIVLISVAVSVSLLLDKRPAHAASNVPTPTVVEIRQEPATASKRKSGILGVIIAPVRALDRLLFPDEPIAFVRVSSETSAAPQQSELTSQQSAAGPVQAAPAAMPEGGRTASSAASHALEVKQLTRAGYALACLVGAVIAAQLAAAANPSDSSKRLKDVGSRSPPSNSPTMHHKADSSALSAPGAASTPPAVLSQPDQDTASSAASPPLHAPTSDISSGSVACIIIDSSDGTPASPTSPELAAAPAVLGQAVPEPLPPWPNGTRVVGPFCLMPDSHPAMVSRWQQVLEQDLLGAEAAVVRIGGAFEAGPPAEQRLVQGKLQGSGAAAAARDTEEEGEELQGTGGSAAEVRQPAATSEGSSLTSAAQVTAEHPNQGAAAAAAADVTLGKVVAAGCDEPDENAAGCDDHPLFTLPAAASDPIVEGRLAELELTVEGRLAAAAVQEALIAEAASAAAAKAAERAHIAAAAIEQAVAVRSSKFKVNGIDVTSVAADVQHEETAPESVMSMEDHIREAKEAEAAYNSARAERRRKARLAIARRNYELIQEALAAERAAGAADAAAAAAMAAARAADEDAGNAAERFKDLLCSGPHGATSSAAEPSAVGSSTASAGDLFGPASPATISWVLGHDDLAAAELQLTQLAAASGHPAILAASCDDEGSQAVVTEANEAPLMTSSAGIKGAIGATTCKDDSTLSKGPCEEQQTASTAGPGPFTREGMSADGSAGSSASQLLADAIARKQMQAAGAIAVQQAHQRVVTIYRRGARRQAPAGRRTSSKAGTPSQAPGGSTTTTTTTTTTVIATSSRGDSRSARRAAAPLGDAVAVASAQLGVSDLALAMALAALDDEAAAAAVAAGQLLQPDSTAEPSTQQAANQEPDAQGDEEDIGRYIKVVPQVQVELSGGGTGGQQQEPQQGLSPEQQDAVGMTAQVQMQMTPDGRAAGNGAEPGRDAAPVAGLELPAVADDAPSATAGSFDVPVMLVPASSNPYSAVSEVLARQVTGSWSQAQAGLAAADSATSRDSFDVVVQVDEGPDEGSWPPDEPQLLAGAGVEGSAVTGSAAEPTASGHIAMAGKLLQRAMEQQERTVAQLSAVDKGTATLGQLLTAAAAGTADQAVAGQQEPSAPPLVIPEQVSPGAAGAGTDADVLVAIEVVVDGEMGEGSAADPTGGSTNSNLPSSTGSFSRLVEQLGSADVGMQEASVAGLLAAAASRLDREVSTAGEGVLDIPVGWGAPACYASESKDVSNDGSWLALSEALSSLEINMEAQLAGLLDSAAARLDKESSAAYATPAVPHVTEISQPAGAGTDPPRGAAASETGTREGRQGISA
eukprot:gene12728-12858_t